MDLGHNVRTDLGYVSSSDRALETGATTFQIFYRPAQSFRSYHRPDQETEQLAKKIKSRGQRLVIHASYLPNLCQPPDDYRHYQGVDIIVEDMNESVKLGAIGVIIHMGNNTKNLLSYGEAQDNFITGVKSILEQSDEKSILILETGCGSGTEVSSSLKELGNIRNSLPDNMKRRVRFCLDTCHMFAYGYDLGDPDNVEFIDYEISRYLGWKNVAVIHLNDSEDNLGSRKDNHADIGRGNINIRGLMSFVKKCTDNNLPLVLETPTHFYNNKRFDHKTQMEWIKQYYDTLYGDFGINAMITDRTKSKPELREKIKELTKSEKNKTKPKEKTKKVIKPKTKPRP